MEKNRMMRLASCLLVLTLLTTCMISGTYAKYVTQDTGTDTARVAKWGVTVTANGTTFAKEYTKDDESATTITNSVVSTDDNKLVAPGTKGTMAKILLGGTPEVAVKVSYVGQFDISDNWTVNGKFYCPLVIKVKPGTGEATTINGISCTSADDFEEAVNNAIAAYSSNYAANTDLSTQSEDSLTVEWEWPFETGTSETEKKANNVKDTYLGNVAAGTVTDKTAPTITLEVTTTVTQID